MIKHLKFDRKRRGLWLILLGAGLLTFSLIKLYAMPQIAQYMAVSPIEKEVAAQGAGDPADDSASGDGTGGEDGAADDKSQLAGLYESFVNAKGEMGEGVKAGMSATIYDCAFTSSASQSGTATLTCADGGYFEAHRKYLKSGRLFSEDEQKNGAKVAVLDQETAFKLFPTTEPTEGKLQISGVWYDVIGVVRHERLPGDSDEYGAYIPILTAANARMQTDYVQIDCLEDISGAGRAVESVGASVLGDDGDYYDIPKEVMRATMILRVLIVIFALYLIGACLRAWNGRTRALIAGWRAEVMHRYFKKMLPGVIGMSLLQVLGYAVLAGAVAGILALMIRPMYVFTEWIPEVVVEWSKISARAVGLMTKAADPMTLKTREYASVRFYGALTRWGVICTLCGLLIFRRGGKRAAGPRISSVRDE